MAFICNLDSVIIYNIYSVLVLGVHWMNQLHNSSLKPNINEWHMVFTWTNMMEDKNIASIWSELHLGFCKEGSNSPLSRKIGTIYEVCANSFIKCALGQILCAQCVPSYY